MTVSPRDADVIREALEDATCECRAEHLAALDALLARVHALERALDGFLRFADADEAANPPGHRNSVLRVHRNVFTEARAARAVVLEGAARREQDLGGIASDASGTEQAR